MDDLIQRVGGPAPNYLNRMLREEWIKLKQEIMGEKKGLKCPHCEIDVPPKAACPECGLEWTIIEDRNYSGFTETLGNVPLTRLLITFMGWPDWLDYDLLKDMAEVEDEDINTFVPIWVEKGIIKMDSTDPDKPKFTLNNKSSFVYNLEMLNNAIIDDIIEADEPDEDGGLRRCKFKGKDNTVHYFDPLRKKTLCGKAYKAWKLIATIKEVTCDICIEKKK